MSRIKNAEKEALHAEFRQALSYVWTSKKMIKFCDEQAEEIIKIENGFLAISKPSIQTNFCFGYHCSRYEDTSDDAYKMAEHATTNVDYFLNENLEPMQKHISFLKDPYEGAREYKAYIRVKYNPDKVGLIKQLEFFDEWEWSNMCESERNKYTPLPQSDLNKYIEAYERVLAHFEKRLQTYIKRYGMSKITSQTYWLDE